MNHNEPLGWTPAADALRLAADLATLRRQAPAYANAVCREIMQARAAIANAQGKNTE